MPCEKYVKCRVTSDQSFLEGDQRTSTKTAGGGAAAGAGKRRKTDGKEGKGAAAPVTTTNALTRVNEGAEWEQERAELLATVTELEARLLATATETNALEVSVM